MPSRATASRATATRARSSRGGGDPNILRDSALTASVFLAAGYLLYQTSQVLAHHAPEQYVSASLALFSSVALMFWYVIRILMRARN